MKKLMILSSALAAFAVCADQVPVVSGITMTQANDSRLVTIDYTLKDATAVITLDIQTNVTDGVWASIGGENIQNVSGDVWKTVEAGARTITWRPDLSWPDHKITNGGARAVVTAWSVDNPPDYLVVDISGAATAASEKLYYPAVEFLPGGLLGNEDYRKSKLVMRKIPAKDVTWTMGSAMNETGSYGEVEATHPVTLTNNYFIGVFEVTQTQWANIQTKRPTPSNYLGAMRPVEQVCYNEIRNSTNETADTDHDYPNDPKPDSFLGLLRAKTGLAFDLPSEAQWEFACRAGHGTGAWGDGSSIDVATEDPNMTRLGRYKYSGGSDGTAIVGSYAPNSWGLYDMQGNVREWCLDWYTTDITGLGGAVNTIPEANAEKQRIQRGGYYGSYAAGCRPAVRNALSPSYRPLAYLGFRLALTLGE